MDGCMARSLGEHHVPRGACLRSPHPGAAQVLGGRGGRAARGFSSCVCFGIRQAALRLLVLFTIQ